MARLMRIGKVAKSMGLGIRFVDTMADNGLYEPNIVEAASMELYQRDSLLLREQFKALTPDILSAIANGTAPAPEGIRLAAKKFLSK